MAMPRSATSVLPLKKTHIHITLQENPLPTNLTEDREQESLQ